MLSDLLRNLIPRLSPALPYMGKSLDEVTDAWRDVLNGSSCCLAKLDGSLEDERIQQIFISFYNEWLQIFGPDLQYLRIPPGPKHPDNDEECITYCPMGGTWALEFLKTESHGAPWGPE